jgi:hypothetical protein
MINITEEKKGKSSMKTEKEDSKHNRGVTYLI